MADGWVCPYCKAVLKTKSGWNNHLCEKKKLAKEIGEANLHRLFTYFVFWLKYNKLGTKTKTYDQFIRSPYFAAFCRLQVAINFGVTDVKEYLRWISKENIPNAKWDNEDTILRFKKYVVKSLSIMDGALNSIEWLNDYCDSKDIQIDRVFDEASTGDLVKAIMSNQIHPVFVVTNQQINSLFTRLTDNALMDIMRYIDYDLWENRIKARPEEAKQITELYDEIYCSS